MQIESFFGKISEKFSPLLNKVQILINSIQGGLSNQQQKDKSAFFASLVQFIRSNIRYRNYENMDAQLLLLNKQIPQVSVALIRAILTTLIEIPLHMISQEKEIKSSLAIIGQLLILSSIEDLANLHNVYDQLLEYTINNKKPIRKQSIKVLGQFYQQRTLDIQHDKYFYQKLGQHFKQNIPDNSDKSQYCIQLLANVNKCIPYNVLADALYLIIDCLSETETELHTYVFLALESILESRIGADQSEKLLKQLLLIQPTDINAQHAYLQCIRQCLISLNEISGQIAAQYLPSVISNFSEFMLSENIKIRNHARLEIVKVIQTTGEKTLSLQINLELDLLNLDLEQHGTVQNKYIAVLEYLMSNRFDNILPIYETFLSTISDQTFHHVQNFILNLVSQKSRWPHQQFQRCFGALVESVSLKSILTLFPIKLNVDPMAQNFDELSNTWLLYILSQYSKGKLEDYLDHLFQYFQLLDLVNDVNGQEQRLMLNIITHILDIGANCTCEYIGQEHLTQVNQFYRPHPKEFAYLQTLLQYNIVIGSEVIQQFVADKAKAFISQLAKNYQQNNKNDLTLSAIKIISYAADQQYLLNSLTKNLQKIQSSKENLDEANLKNMDIALQVVGATQFTSDLWNFCIEFVKNMIHIPKIQKKIYKFISEIMDQVHPSFVGEVYQILQDSACQISSRQKRFQCFLKLLEKQLTTARFQVDDFQDFIQYFLPEIVVAIRDNNFKTRQFCEKLLDTIGKKLIEIDFLEQFISMVFAGLAASPAMKADAIVTVGVMVQLFHNNLKPEFIAELTNLILLLAKEKNNEVYKSILEYVKVLIKLKCSQMQMKQILYVLFNDDIQSRDKNRIVVKRLLIKMIRSYGEEFVHSQIPEDHQKLLKNAVKAERRTKKNKNKNKSKDEEKKKIKKKQLKDLDTDDENDEQPLGKNDQMETENNDNNLLLKYDFKKEQFHFEEPLKLKKEVQVQTPKPQLVDFVNGKVVVKESKEVLGQKRRRETHEEDDDKAKKVRTDPKGNKKRQDTVHVIKESGATFKPNRAGGDILVKGRPEPFAFIQLNPKALNKRFKNKASKAFDGVFQKKSLKGVKVNK
ncbi:hypothetical protein pb186bvf_005391 [Paramecium bursaria]